ncbi:MAG: hypothetical protein Q8P05_02390 [Candidatus Diapherotrites archaeon]|nr:hypothetical protein [Candidatus Diapherotrites archaeon]
MDFSKEELSKIKKDKIFIKQINNSKYWIKPLFEHKTYLLGNVKSHKKYFQALKKYLRKHIPETKFIKFDKRITLIVQKDITGKKLTKLKEIKELMNLKQNKSFRNGLKKLLENKKWVIDLYIYKENFISTKNKELFYIDGRMPIFPEPKEDRYQISKKRTLWLLRQTE